MPNENYYIKLEGNKHRLLTIEYFKGKPSVVITEEFWDHSNEPWSKKGRHRTTGSNAMHFDFDYSKVYDQLYWHCSGGGGNGKTHCIGRLIGLKAKIWAAPDIQLTKYVKRKGKWIEKPVTKEDLKRFGYTMIKSPLILKSEYREPSINPFDHAEGDTECVWCPQCKDHLPDEPGRACEHLRWCDECSSWIIKKTKQWLEGDSACEHKENDKNE